MREREGGRDGGRERERETASVKSEGMETVDGRNTAQTNIELYVIFHLMLIGISGVQQIPCQSVPTNCGPPL